MARGVNKVILIGNLGADPEVRYMPSGAAVANVSLATSESRKDKQTGENVEQTEWHRVIFFNRLAEIAGQYLRKGSKVFVEGRIQTRKWQDKSGVERYTTEIVAQEMQMLDSRGGAASGESFSDNERSAGSSSMGQSSGSSSHSQPSPATIAEADFDDDIPF